MINLGLRMSNKLYLRNSLKKNSKTAKKRFESSTRAANKPKKVDVRLLKLIPDQHSIMFNPITNSFKRLSGKRPLLATQDNLVSSNLNITIGPEVKNQRKRSIKFQPKDSNKFFLNGVQMDRKHKSGRSNRLSVDISSKKTQKKFI